MSERSERAVQKFRELLPSFSAADLSIRLHPADHQAPDLVQLDVLDEGEIVGSIKRRIVDNGRRPLFVLHEELELWSDYQRRGFGTAFYAWSERAYRELGIRHISINAQKAGSYVWAKWGFEFDTEWNRYVHAARTLGVETPDQIRAAAVLELLRAQGELLERSTLYGNRYAPNAAEVLDELSSAGDDEAGAVACFKEQVPDEACIKRGDLHGKFTSPGAIAAFDVSVEANGIDVGRKVLLASSWQGWKTLEEM